jgi:hypothetical protein
VGFGGFFLFILEGRQYMSSRSAASCSSSVSNPIPGGGVGGLA